MITDTKELKHALTIMGVSTPESLEALAQNEDGYLRRLVSEVIKFGRAGVSSECDTLLASGEDGGKGGTLFAGVVIARKKPVEIEAIQCREPNNIDDIMRFCPIAKQSDGGESGLVWVIIPTLEGEHQAKYEDWIIKGVQGEFYPCKPDIFAQTYDMVGEANKVG